MAQPHMQDGWQGWSTISANEHACFTVWLTGLPGTGKTTLAGLVQQALTTRGHKVQLLTNRELSHWLQDELHVQESFEGDRSDLPGYDAFLTYLCYLLARNGIITITSSISPYLSARRYARAQINRFVEVYLYCTATTREKRIHQREPVESFPEQLYEVPTNPDLAIDTDQEEPERSALRIIERLEQQSYIAPICGEHDDEDPEIATIKARLEALGYLE